MSHASTAVLPEPEPAQPAQSAQPALSTDPGERGSLHIADRVVERVAAYAVTLVAGAGAAPRRVLGVDVGEREAGDRPNVTAQVDGDTAAVTASIAVRWPLPVRDVVAEIRRRVRTEVARTTDVQVDHVDVEVVSMDVTDRRARVR